MGGVLETLRSHSLVEWIVWPFPSWRSLVWFVAGFFAGGLACALLITFAVISVGR